MPLQSLTSTRPLGLSVLGSAAVCAVALSALGGWLLGSHDTPVYGVSVVLGAAALGLHTVRSTLRRIQATLAQSTQALRSMGRGETGFRLNAHGLPEFDELLLAIDDLRGAIEPSSTPKPNAAPLKTAAPSRPHTARDEPDAAWALNH